MTRDLIICAGILLVLAGAFYTGTQWKQREWDAAVGQQQVDAAARSETQRRDSDAVATDFFDALGQAEHDADADVPAIVARCLGVLPDGLSLRPGTRDPAGVPGGAGVAAPAGRPDAAAAAWCEQLGKNYRAGLRNTARLNTCSAWIKANGGAPGATPAASAP